MFKLKFFRISIFQPVYNLTFKCKQTFCPTIIMIFALLILYLNLKNLSLNKINFKFKIFKLFKLLTPSNKLQVLKLVLK